MDESCCYFEPLFDDASKMDEYFASHGFSDIIHIVVYTSHAFIFLPSYDRCCNFVDYFDATVINGSNIRTYVVRSSDIGDYKRENPTREKTRLISKTVIVKQYPLKYLSDRNLWNDFRESGFIRDIETKPPFGYIRFDTEDDAIRAVKDMNGVSVGSAKIIVEMIPDQELGLPDMSTKLTIVDK